MKRSGPKTLGGRLLFEATRATGLAAGVAFFFTGGYASPLFYAFGLPFVGCLGVAVARLKAKP